MPLTVFWFPLWLQCYFVMFPTGYSEEVITKDGDMSYWWSSRSFKLIPDNKNRGEAWVNNDKVVNTCGIGINADFWFLTEHFDLNTTFADVVHVDVEAGFRLCENPAASGPEDPGVPCSVYYFEVYIYRGKNPPVIKDLKNVKPDELRNFSSLYNITNSTTLNKELTKTNHSFSFKLGNNLEGVTFAARSRGACCEISRMKMYYYYCKETFFNGIKFERTAAPSFDVKNKTVLGTCSSQNSTHPSYASVVFTRFCYDTGNWSSVDPKAACLCDNGFVLDDATQMCSPLPKPTTILRGNRVNITWVVPNENIYTQERITFNVECFECSHNQTLCNSTCTNEQYSPQMKNLSQSWVVVSNLSSGKSYVFRVSAKNNLTNETLWQYQETNPVTVPVPSGVSTSTRVPTTTIVSKQFPSSTVSSTSSTAEPSSETEDSLLQYIIIGAACLLFLILIILIVICVKRRKRDPRKNNRNGYINHGVELPRVGQRLYVDPTNYEDPEAAVKEFTNELDLQDVFLERLIGGGEFGDVYKGELTKKGKKKIPVAVKTLKHDANERSSRDFMLEASVLGQFDNPNVVKLEGVITKSTPRMIVLEYVSNGSLDNYLKSNDSLLTNLQLLGMARGVAAGMKYLSGINFVHRDLAARNILVNDDLLCKIADFGLSRELEAKEASCAEYSTTGGKIPVRWTAPEAIKFRKFSTASDVWSFGILLWEIMSFAERPYWEWDNFKVMERIDEGYRLPPPQNCPKGVHGLMLHCWKAERSERPGFGEITNVIEKWIRSPETMEDELDHLTTIGDWLNSMKMGLYEPKFVTAGYKRISHIVDLDDEGLKTIGVNLIGHRNKIMKGIDSVTSKQNRKSMSI